MTTLSSDDVSTAAQSGHPDPQPGFRTFMRGYVTGVAVVTSTGADDRPHGLTCTSLASVTMDPPTLLVCLDTCSGTLAAIRQRGSFMVNLLHAAARQTAELFAAPRPDRFGAVAWRLSPRRALPWLAEDSFAAAECDAVDLRTVGDHVVVFGRVVEVTGGDGRPLLYGRRSYLETQP
ncbi:flavin reductase family protein [Micromonospora sp. WMMD998]|uniref:flavin reductase family protein n=1 Tax=Micromonospora sp. WMMD998 TaxID=3016092 RepID=UPI00249C043B|nr:flavin reductase family protein [Micromonospora sp. WMMD998]WFE40996.1 flavin reductase family protein [Micromonospora sp. WMMD998]